MAEDEFCYVTTVGRRSSKPHTIEIWFARDANVVYMLAGGGESSDWVKNIQADPTVGLRIGEERFVASARVVSEGDEDARARRLLLEKYEPTYSGDLTEWGETAMPVAIDIASG